jgi:DNA-binding transcriptional LysR family regulator
VRTTAAEDLREAVFAGLGLCVASKWIFRPDLDSGKVTRVLPAWNPAVDGFVGDLPDGQPPQRRKRAPLPPSSRISYGS